MSIPFNDPSNVFYDQYSIEADDIEVPDHFDWYTPDNDDDFKCAAIIVASPERGAKVWTKNGGWITIGIYRDEGRTAEIAETRRVFRLLPSFRLLTLAEVDEIFAETEPDQTLESRTLFDLTIGQEVILPKVQNELINYELPASTKTIDPLPLDRRFDQVYAADKAPLPLTYRPDGQPRPVNNVDSKFKNEHVLFHSPITSEDVVGDVSAENSRVYVYDFYGLDLNDVTRAPYFASDIITRDLTLPAPRNNIKRKEASGSVIWPGLLFDQFGHRAIGVQANNCLTVRLNILPLSLDAFNKPIKAPLAKRIV